MIHNDQLIAPIADLYYTQGEVALRFGVTSESVLRWVREGKIDGEKIGREVLIPKWQAEAFLQEWLQRPISRGRPPSAKPTSIKRGSEEMNQTTELKMTKGLVAWIEKVDPALRGRIELARQEYKDSIKNGGYYSRWSVEKLTEAEGKAKESIEKVQARLVKIQTELATRKVLV